VKKRFIEWDLPLADISEESAKEKNIRHSHPSTLHIWWARRPLASSRVTNFAALIDLPESEEEKKEIMELIKRISKWDSVKNGNNADIRKARDLIKKKWGDNPPKVLDPFGGGGTIPLEALRLGCKTYSNDLNPVAVLIQKATLEWPQKFSQNIEVEEEIDIGTFGATKQKKKINKLVFFVEKYGKRISTQVKKELSRFYPKDPDNSEPVGYIWARTIPCQNLSCKVEIPLIKQFWLCKKPNKKIAYKIIVNKKIINFAVVEDNEIDFNPDEGTVRRGDVCCPCCGNVIKANDSRKLFFDGKFNERMIVAIFHKKGANGKKYRIANNKDVQVYKEAEEYLIKKIDNWRWDCDPLPEEFLPKKGTLGISPYYTEPGKWKDLLNARQQLALVCFLDKVKEASELLHKENNDLDNEFINAVIGYLSILLNWVADFSTKVCFLNANGGRGIIHTFGRQIIPIGWDYAEGAIFNPEGASWDVFVDKIIKNILFLQSTSMENFCTVLNSSATSLDFSDNSFDAIFTDPPYYDAVPYADLSDFFYVWFKKTVASFYPDFFSTPLTPKLNEAVANPVRFNGDKNQAKIHFEKMLYDSFKEMYRILKYDGLATIVYAHKTIKGWEAMLNSLISAGFVVTASWPLHTEKTKWAAKASLASSIYMVCRKTKKEKVGFFNEIRGKIQERVEEKLKQFWNEGISGGDFFISAIGPGMEIFSQYEKVEKFSGEQVSTIELLDYIREISTNWITRRLLQGAESSNVDKEAQFYLAYRWTYLENSVPFDDALKLANASGVDLTQYWDRDGFIQKKGSDIKVLGPKDRKTIKETKNMVDGMHKAVQIWEKGDRKQLAEFLSLKGYQQNNAFWQFCQAVSECLLDTSKEKTLLQGFLLGKDALMKESASSEKQQELF
jgi:adenine-specific DNA methylase